MYTSRFLNRHTNNIRLSNSIIRIYIKRLDSWDACTCGGLYYSAELLPMGFTLPRTRLVHNHLVTLSCQRLDLLLLSPLLLYVSLTDSLEFQNAILLKSLSNCIHYNTTMKSRQESHEITSTHAMSIFLTPNPRSISSIIISCQCLTNQPIHVSSHVKHNI